MSKCCVDDAPGKTCLALCMSSLEVQKSPVCVHLLPTLRQSSLTRRTLTWLTFFLIFGSGPAGTNPDRWPAKTSELCAV